MYLANVDFGVCNKTIAGARGGGFCVGMMRCVYLRCQAYRRLWGIRIRSLRNWILM